MAMNHISQFPDLPSIRMEDECIDYDRTWASYNPYYQWNGSLAAHYSDVFESRAPVNYTAVHDESRLERFLVEPHFSLGPADPFQSSLGKPEMNNSLAYSKTYEAAFPETYARQSSPTNTNSSHRSVCHSDDASTDRAARYSMSSCSDYSISQPTTVALPPFSAGFNQFTPGGGVCALSEIQQYADESHTDSDAYETAEDIGHEPMTYEHSNAQYESKIAYVHPDNEKSRVKEESVAVDRADSEQPDVKDDEDGSDTEYKPHRKASINKRPRRRSSQSSASSNGVSAKRQSRGRKGSLCSANNDRIKKSRGHKSKPSTSDTTVRPFPCPFAGYHCESTFTSKNEWKRHVSTQHIKLGFWRCDMCDHTNAKDSSSPGGHNDFNRKDLFTQHLRRMHSEASSSGTKSPTSPTKKSMSLTGALSEDVIAEHQKRCYVRVRSPPPRSSCLFCSRTFAGEGSWQDRMDHVGSHLERDRKNATTGAKITDAESWREDKVLQEWLLEEGLIEIDPKGFWKIGDGIPIRERGDMQDE